MLDERVYDRYTHPMSKEDIRTIRERAGLSRSEMARALMTSYLTVYRWEIGSQRPAPYYVRQLRELESKIAPKSE